MRGILFFALIIGFIWIEVIFFGLVSSAIGVLPTIIGVFVTAAIGIRLFRRSSRAALERMTTSLKQGKSPAVDVADGVASVLGAGLLLIPGYFTDAIGFMLFVPVLRSLIVFGLLFLFWGLFSYAFSAYSKRFNAQNEHKYYDSPSPSENKSDDVIEGQYKRED